MLKLRLLTGPRAGRQLRVSDTKPVSVGRRVGRLRLHDTRVSKKHAKIFFAGGSWVLRDLGSANGTYVNKRKCDGLVELETGDVIQMGRVLIKVLQADAVGMDPMRGVPGAKLDGLSAAAAAASTQDKAQAKLGDGGEIDLASILGDESGDDDLLDFSDVSQAGASHAGMTKSGQSFAGQTQLDGSALSMEPVDPSDLVEDQPAGDASSDSDAPKTQDDDPLLAGVDESADADSGDLISLDDEDATPHRPTMPGTTLLTAITDDSDLDQDEIDDETPAVVGLRLDQAAPQQPTPAQIEAEVEPEVEAEAVGDAGDAALDAEARAEFEAESESEAKTAAEVDVDVDADDEEDQPAATKATSDDDRAADDSLTDVESPADEALDLETAHAELAFEDVLESADAAPAEVDAQELVSETEIAGVTSGTGAAEDPDEAEDAAEPDIAAALAQDTDAPVDEETPLDVFDIDAAFDALSEGLDDSVTAPAITDAVDQAAEPVAEDAQAQDTASDADAAEHEQAGAGSELAGSQLDIGFIRDALAKLGDEPESPNPKSPEAEPETFVAEDSHPSISDDTESPSAAAARAEAKAEQPITAPPGLNPTTVLPPAEPNRSSRSVAKPKRKWFFTVMPLILLVGIGAGVAMVLSGSVTAITGRDDTNETTNPATDNNQLPPATDNGDTDAASGLNPDVTSTIDPAPGTGKPGTGNPGNGNPGTGATGTTDPEPIERRPFDPAGEPLPQLAGAAPIPSPFQTGPAVIGGDALSGVVNQSRDPFADPVPRPNPSDPQPEPPTDPEPPTIAPQPPVEPESEPAFKPLPPPEDADPRIVFLVDASGSMIDSLPQMLNWLNKAVQTIEADERFTVIFFRSGKAIEAQPAGMATPTAERLAVMMRDWLNPEAAPVLPAGRSDPSAALAKAIAYEPTDIYLLSDQSFARFAGDTTQDQAIKFVAEQIGKARVRLHGVQFFYEDEGGVLETLANRYHGKYEFVKEDVIPAGDVIDLLDELDNNR